MIDTTKPQKSSAPEEPMVPRRRELRAPLIRRRFRGGLFPVLFSQKTKRRVFRILRAGAHFLLGFLFGTLPLPEGMYPCGSAFLCAVNEDVLLTAIGNGLACILYGRIGAAYLALTTLVYLLRRFISGGRFDEPPRLRTAIALTVSLLCGGSVVFASAERVAALKSALVYTLSLPVMTFLFMGRYPSKQEKSSSGTSPAADASLLVVLLSSLIRLSARWQLLLFPAQTIACTVVQIAALSGFLPGVYAGLLCGLPADLYAGRLVFMPVMALAGGAAGALSDRRQTVRMTAFAVSLVLSVWLFFGDGRAAMEMLSCAVMSFAVYLPLSPYLPHDRGRAGKLPASLPGAGTRFERLSAVFSSLSDTFYQVSEKQRFPEKEEVSSLVGTVCASHCGRCPMQKTCYGKTLYEEYRVEDVMTERLMNGGLKKSDLPEKYAAGCPHLGEIVEALNEGYTSLVNDRFSKNGTEILASEYSAMARIIKYTGKKAEADRRRDELLTKKASSAFSALGLRFGEVEAYGERRKTVALRGVVLADVPYTGRELASRLSEAAGMDFDEPSYQPHGRKYDLVFERKKTFRPEFAQAARAKDNGQVNGDTASFFESDEGYFYAFISDGMGSGRSAALTSRLTAVFVEKLLTTGAHKNITLELLNDLLLSKNDESFATVDLLEIDLFTGESSFVKAGAAPAYIVRASKLYKIASLTPPAGIIRGFSAESTRFSLKKGDMVLMLSDGILQSSDEVPWLCEMLSFEADDDPSKLAGRILDKARRVNLREDDMTCVAVKMN